MRGEIKNGCADRLTLLANIDRTLHHLYQTLWQKEVLLVFFLFCLFAFFCRTIPEVQDGFPFSWPKQ